MTLTSLVLWLVVSTSVLGLSHLYLRKRLLVDSALPPRALRIASLALVLLLLLQPLTLALFRNLPREVGGPMAFVAFGWLGLFSTIFCLLALHDLARAAARFVRGRWGRDDAPADPGKRLTLQRWTTAALSLAGLGLFARGASNALGSFHVKPVEIFLRKLPPEFDGFTIAQLSDVHIGPTIGRDFVERMVAVTNELQPDLIAITGDLVDGDVERLGAHAAPLAELRAPHGTWFVTGNHEYYSGADEWIDELARLGIPTLRNRRVSLERDGATVDLAGVTDYTAARYGDPPDLDAALRGRDPTRELLLLAHQPAAVREASRRGVGLQLSGHTHGGQFWPWNWVVRFVQPIARGWGRFGDTQIWVNTGTGYWGPPMRTGTVPEITRLVLRRSTGSNGGAHARA